MTPGTNSPCAQGAGNIFGAGYLGHLNILGLALSASYLHKSDEVELPYKGPHKPSSNYNLRMLDFQVSLYVASAILALYYLQNLIRRSKVRHPPSPLSLPFVGNMFSIPPGHEYVSFAKIGKQLKCMYGQLMERRSINSFRSLADIVYLEILGHKHIILNSAEAISDVLEKRTASYSSRPPVPMVKDPSLMNWPGNLPLMEYGDAWRHYRRIMNNWLSIRAVAQFNDFQEQQARFLLRRLLSTTNHVQPFEHIKDEINFALGSMMLQLAYGYKPKTPQDPFMKELQLTVHNVTSASMQTSRWRTANRDDLTHTMAYIPDWFPGTGWKVTAREYGAQKEKARKEPYEWVKSRVATGTHQTSIIGSLLQDHELLSGSSAAERVEWLKEIGVTTFGAGADTVSDSCSRSTVYDQRLIPVARAQRELTSLLGHAVLPKMSDKKRLPYIRNLIDEVLRLYPVMPFGEIGSSVQDIWLWAVIPVITKILKCLIPIGFWTPRFHVHQPLDGVDGEYILQTIDLKYERHPTNQSLCMATSKCPGFHFAEDSAFIIAASMLSIFTFLQKKDINGDVIVPQAEPERNSMIFELKPFEFELRLRSEEHRQLVLSTSADGI
ncbi:cytochrome P450 domain-containing protein [Rhizoctonia solani AG-1 IA]|uniref:Cytochrome P450 domain-containing protein n=1 Tax=Thanatephorus cucumeris (strain AG1-IA) TaxID=983506 RepID=L8WPN9_THACA|nr:cytochrome P450 domain-containing protein [Rhizoctonia solani AG-1 IA]